MKETTKLKPKFKMNEQIKVIANGYTKDIGISGLVGKISKILYKRVETQYNIICGDDHICCLPESFLIKEGGKK